MADEVGEGEAKLVAVSLVLLVLTTVLPPILRRIQSLRERPSPPVAATEPSLPARRDGLELLASEAVSIAERIDALNRGGTIRREEIRREVERLRNLARTFQD